MKLMDLREVAKIAKAHIITTPNREAEVKICCCSDLMADILRLKNFEEPEKALLITGLYTLQTVNTVELTDIPHILFVRQNKIDQSLIRAAEEYGISILNTEISMFEACGLLYRAGFLPPF